MEARYFYSALLSSLRSVTFVLQAAGAGVPGFKEWYKITQERLRNSNEARTFVERRNASEKRGYTPIALLSEGVIHTPLSISSHLTPRENTERYLDELAVGNGGVEIVPAAQRQLGRLCAIFDECIANFGPWLRPSERYTLDGIERTGISIEDVEEEFGYPRGWTRGATLEERLRIFWSPPEPQLAEMLERRRIIANQHSP